MKKKYTYIILQLFTVFLLIVNQATAQFESSNKEALMQMDTSVLKGKAFLNKATVIKSFIDPLRSKEKSTDGIPILTLWPRHFEALTSIVEKADLNEKPKPKQIAEFQAHTRNELVKNNIIPIGIINADATILTKDQVEENINAKKQNKKADSKDYENIEMIAAGLLQGEVFQGNVQFRISPELVQTNINNPIERLEIDFQDGKGWRSYSMTDQLISYQFSTTGEVVIAIKLITKRGSYITYCPFKIHILELPKPFASGKISNSNLKNGRLGETVDNGEFEIYTGCDGEFDRPIIIAEGFDVGQDVVIYDLLVRYYARLYALRNNGYDLVFVNYNNGRADMKQNAQVLIDVINRVNVLKSGGIFGEKITIIGESMSGLIARYALCQMEHNGQSHYVSRFIAFDTPNQGANVPPGLVEMRRNMDIIGGWVSFYAYLFSPEVRALDTPAAKQLLLFHNGLTKDSAFDAFRQDLANLGNGGYPNPAFCKSIALLNGSIAGTRQADHSGQNNLNPGDKILDINFIGIICNAFLAVWTNNIGQNTKIFEGLGVGLCNGIGFTNTYANLPINLDRLPGGYIKQDIPSAFPILGTTSPRFSFVPTFSSIDYRGNPISDNDYRLIINDNNIINGSGMVIRTDLTPFKTIYGPVASSAPHTDLSFNEMVTAWNNLIYYEFGITNPLSIASGCTIPTPPAVMEARQEGRWGYWANRSLPTAICKYQRNWKNNPNTKILVIPAGNQYSSYVQEIQVTGPGVFLPLRLDRNNRAIFDYNDLAPGTYTITAIRKFYGGTSTGQVSTSSVIQIQGNCRTGVSCPGDEDMGEVIGVLPDVNKECYAIKSNGVWIAVLEDGTFIPRNRLIANGISVDGANCFAETDPQGSNPESSCGNRGSITYQRWENINGVSIEDLRNGTNTFQNSPSFSQNITSFEAPSNILENYGSRIRGYICPPTSGNYIFWVRGDDHVELWLSTDNQRDNSHLIAYHHAWTSSDGWEWFSTQKSIPIYLEAGHQYYIEARMKEGTGGDNLAVGWQLPNGALERPILGNRLIPFENVGSGNGNNCNFTITASSSNYTPACGTSILLSADCISGACDNQITYSWPSIGNSKDVNTNVPSSNGTYNYTVTAIKPGCDPKYATTPSITVSTCTNQNSSFSQCIESENSDGSAPISDDPNASNGYTRGVYGNANHYVNYSVTSVPSAGTYTAVLRYYDGGNINVIVNGVTQSISLPNSGSWNIVYTEYTFSVSLSLGSNTIRIEGTGGNATRQDKLCISGGGSSGNCSFDISAGSSDYNPGCQTGITLTAYCNGNDCNNGVTYSWSRNGLSGNNYSVSTNAPSANGNYYYTVTAHKGGCNDKSADTPTISVTNCGTTGNSNCSAEAIDCSGNQYEVRNYYVNASSAGTYSIKVLYRSHEGTGKIRWSAGGSTTEKDVAETNEYLEVDLGTAYLNNGSNTIALSSGLRYVCFKKVCIQSAGARIGVINAKDTNPVATEEIDILQLYPNPTSGKVTTRYYLEKGEKARLQFMTIGGTILTQKALISAGGWQEDHTDLTNQPNGTYLVRFEVNKRVITRKFVIMK